jgi:cellulose synthase/poly-beta-1,6-N-acetylglucosamine synthase-like glycosyltransferase
MPHTKKVKQSVQPAKAQAVKRAKATSTKSAKAKLRVVALVPAHNEEDIIQHTIESLMGQTWPLDYALIIADNCTDNTVKIVKKYQKKYGSDRLRLMKTVGNTHKKAGALNQGFLTLKGKRPAFVFGMDADTILHPGIIEAGVKQFEQEPQTGGICSAYRTLPLKEDATRWQRYLWRLQNIEFGLANAWRVENQKSARVLPGVSVIFRTKALRDVYKEHADGTVWATDSLVEDYRLTLEIKDLGWEVKSCLDMISWSDVPLKLRGKGGLFDQRQRWYSGTVDELRIRGLQRHSRYEIFTISLLTFNLFMQLLLYATYGIIAATHGGIHWISPFLALPVAAAALQFHRWVRYADQRDKWQAVMTITLIPNELYAIFRELVYAYSIWLSYRRPNRAW